MRSWPLLLLEHQSETWRSPGTHRHFPTENIWSHVGKIWLLMWVRVKFKQSTCFRVSCWGDSSLGLSWGYRSWGTLTMKGDARWERSTLGISLDMSCSTALALAKAACSDWHSPMAPHTTPGFSLKYTQFEVTSKTATFYSYSYVWPTKSEEFRKSLSFPSDLEGTECFVPTVSAEGDTWNKETTPDAPSHGTRLHNDYSVPARHGLTSPSMALIQFVALCSHLFGFPFSFKAAEGPFTKELQLNLNN